jgi:diguanylate cyclase (GGDEF)-like protein
MSSAAKCIIVHNKLIDHKRIRDESAQLMKSDPSLSKEDAMIKVATSIISELKAGSQPQFSRNTQDIEFAHEVLNELAEVDELFRYPVSKATTLPEVMKDIAPSFKYIGEDTNLDQEEDFGADKKLLFKNEFGKRFDVYVKGNDLWIDVSRFDTGERGSAVYAAVGNYAHNAGKVFIGDPAGLSPDATIRRTSAMLSLALRFGNTDFMEPSESQRKGIPELGVKPLKWQGSDVDRARSLIDTFLSNLERAMPEIKNVGYNFDARQFINISTGKPIDISVFSKLRDSAYAGKARAARTGEATARRGAFIRSLISSESSERPRILEQVLSRASSLVKDGGLKGAFSRNADEALGEHSKSVAKKLRVAEQELRTSPLTGIPNHKAFLEKEVAPFVAAIDVDSLKYINDSMGHQAGNDLLKAVARVLAEHVDAYHISGDELLARGDSLEALTKGLEAAQRELKSGKYTIVSDTASFNSPSFSFGVAKSANKDSKQATLDDVVKRADLRMLDQKAERELSGHRAARGEAPKGFSVTKAGERPKSAIPSRPSLNIFTDLLEAQSHLVEQFGSGVNRLVLSGVLNFTKGKESWPDSAQNAAHGDEEAVYINSKAYIDLNATDKSRLSAVLLHELGEHFNLKHMIGAAAYRSLQSKVSDLAMKKGSQAEKVWREVARNYPSLTQGSEPFVSEVIAKLGEKNTNSSWYKNLVAKIKAFLIKNGLGAGFVAGTLNESDMHTLLVSSLHNAASTRTNGKARLYDSHNESRTSINDDYRFSFAGQHAATADQYKLANAQQRIESGEDPETVRKDTGWHKGAENKWRFEIDDSDAFFKGTGNFKELVMKRFALLHKGAKEISIGDILYHPALFAAYPQIANIEVRFIPEGEKAKGRLVSTNENYRIEIKGDLSSEEALSVLLHETQHAIQTDEGFSSGGNTSQFKDLTEKPAMLQSLEDVPFADLTPIEQKVLAKLRIQFNNQKKLDQYTQYKNLSGEVEARNTQARQHMTAAQRKATPLSATADVKDSDVIVMFNGKVMENAPMPDNAGDNANNDIRFSRTSNIIDSVTSEESRKRIEVAFSKTAGGAKAQSFGLLTLRQIADITSKVLPNIQNVFVKNLHAMDTEKNKRLSAAGEIATEWAKLPEAISNEMSDLMHDSTIAGVDGSKPYVPVIDIIAAHAKIKMLSKRMMGMSGEPKEKMMAERKELYMLIGFEKKRVVAYPDIKDRFEALALKSPEAAKIYNESRDYHEQHFADTLEALKERIGDSEASPEVKKNLIAKLRLKFESLQAQAPYFPLARFGDYWVHTRDGEETHFNMFESPAEQEAFINQMGREGIAVMGSGKQLENLKDVDGVSAEFITEVDSLISSLGDLPVVNDLRDSVYQLYLNSLPDVSARKHFIHRKKTKGFAQDQLRAFAKKSLHDSNSIAKLKYGYKLQATLDESKEVIEIASSKVKRDKATLLLTWIDEYLSADMTLAEINTKIQKTTDDSEYDMFVQFKKWKNGYSTAALNNLYDHTQNVLDLSENIGREDRIFAVNALDEVRKSYKDIMNPMTHPLAQRLNSIGFAWYLGLTPAASLVNLTQTPVVSLPLLAAKVGWSNASKAMLDVTKLFFKNVSASRKDGMPWVNGLSIKDELAGNELKAYEHWIDSGLLDVTLAHDLAGLSDEGILTNTGKHKLMNVLSFGFHHAERMNREITALAAYRAAINKGMNHSESIEFASKLVLDSHFDYTSSNRARFMRGNVARVVTQFKQYSQNLTYLYARTFQQAYGNSSPEEKAEARKALKGLLIMQASVAGTLGLPMVGVLMGIAQALADVFGDDDDPEDIEGSYRQLLADLVTSITGSTEAGNKFSLIMSKGLVDGLTPFSIAGRLSASDLWIRSSDKELEGTDRAWDWAKTIMGPMAGLLLENPAVAMSMMSEGHYERGLEHMMPKAVKDTMKAIRFSTQGVENMRGDQITEDYGIIEGVGQVLGFSSSQVADIYDQNNAIKRIQTKMDDRRQSLLSAAAKAKMKKDTEAYSEIQVEIKEFNTKNPSHKITPMNIIQSVKGREKRSKETHNGMYLSKRNRELEDKYRFATGE